MELALSNRPGDGLQQLRPPPSNPFTILCCESWLGPGKDRRGPSVSPRWLQEDLSMNGSRRGKGAGGASDHRLASRVSRLAPDPEFEVPSPCPGRALGAPGPLLSLQCGPMLSRAVQPSRTGERPACGVHRSPSCSKFVALTPEGSVLCTWGPAAFITLMAPEHRNQILSLESDLPGPTLHSIGVTLNFIA